MNSTFKSIGKFFPLVILVGCQSSGVGGGPAPSVQVREELAQEISLKADREELAELRQQVPAEKKEANDELALLLNLMGEVKLRPSEVQARYQSLTLKRRDQFRKKADKLRADFRKEEAKRKEKFLKEQGVARKDFKPPKGDRAASKEFFAEQDHKRREFFDGEKDRRKDFESELTTQSKDFDSYMREKQKEFSEQLRLYSKRFSEVEKEKRELEQAKREAERFGKKAAAHPSGNSAVPVQLQTTEGATAK